MAYAKHFKKFSHKIGTQQILKDFPFLFVFTLGRTEGLQ